MFGIPILNDEATHILCDNKSVVTYTSNVESSLNKKHYTLLIISPDGMMLLGSVKLPGYELKITLLMLRQRDY